jgi:HPr kinase/phosphorylase
MYTLKDFQERHGSELQLQLIAGAKGLRRCLSVPEAHRPGLALSGYLEGYADRRILVMGRVEIRYLRSLPERTRVQRLRALLSRRTPAIIVARRFQPPKDMIELCEEARVPLYRSPLRTADVWSRVTVALSEDFAPSTCLHGTLVEVFGVGIVIQGDSSVGKSEAALGLIERGHRLISDDVVKVTRRENGFLEGRGDELTRHHLEIRGIGIINVANHYGAVCIRDSKRVDIVVLLERWSDDHSYDRVGLEDRCCDILDVQVPLHVLPVKPGRDVVLLIETTALNTRLKQMGRHSAREFNERLLATIERNRVR